MKYIRLFFSKKTLYRCDCNFLMSKLVPYISPQALLIKMLLVCKLFTRRVTYFVTSSVDSLKLLLYFWGGGYEIMNIKKAGNLKMLQPNG